MNYLKEFVDYLGIKSFSRYTIRNYFAAIERFLEYLQCDCREINGFGLRIKNFFIERIESVNKRSVSNEISAIRTFLRFLEVEHGIEPPDINISTKFSKKLPNFFSVSQIKHLLNSPDRMNSAGKISEFIWRRDKAALELLYSSGIRVGELVSIKLKDVDWQNCVIKIFGKGAKERIVPIAKHTIQTLILLHSITPQKTINSPLIPTKNGTHMSSRNVQVLIKKYLNESKLPISMSPHSCRHSYATHMLHNGADIRVVQELLGHANLSTTQNYTHVNIEHLKNVYNTTHPHQS